MRQRSLRIVDGIDHFGGGLELPRGVQGAADPHFGAAVRLFAAMFPGRPFGGGAFSVYLHGKPVVDVWTGWSDRRGRVKWSENSAAMVFSGTKGMAATVIHRLADRGLIDYDTPVAEYWPAFAANGKATMTVRTMMEHRGGLSHVQALSTAELLDHELMEQRLAAAAPGPQAGRPAYHALTFGWLLSGLARAVTGKGMAELIRTELAEPLNTDGLYLGRPPADAPTQCSRIVMPQQHVSVPIIRDVVPMLAALPGSRALGAVYFPGVIDSVQGTIPLLDTEAPAVNGVATARGLARMYGAIANGGVIDGTRFLSSRVLGELAGPHSLHPDGNLGVPLPFRLGYHGTPLPAMLPGFGHIGLGGSSGWADPGSGAAFGFVHNRLLTPFVLTDHAGFVALGNLIRRGVAALRGRTITPVPEFGAPFTVPAEAVG